MTRVRIPIVLAATSALFLTLNSSAFADTTVTADLRQVNNSGAGGTVSLTATDGGRLRVVISAHGLPAGLPHAQHIHGSFGGEHFMCPNMADDTDGDGILTNEEASGEYGSIFMSLTTTGDSSPDSGLALDRMPVADASGQLEYRRTFSAESVPDSLLNHLSEVHIVQHGIDDNDNSRYDLASLGVSTFAKNLGLAGVPEEATDPAACGVVTGAGAPIAPHGGVETGGASDGPVNGPLAALGTLLLTASAVFFIARRPARVLSK